MKRQFPLLLIIFALILLCACTSKSNQYQNGIVALQSGDYTTAIELLSDAAKTHPSWTSVYINLAEAYEASGNLDKAKEVLQQGINGGADELLIQEKLYEYEYYYTFESTPIRAVRSITTFTSPQKAVERNVYTSDNMLYARCTYTYNSRDNLVESLTYRRVAGDWIGYDDVQEQVQCMKCRYTYDSDTLIQKVVSYGSSEADLVPFSSRQYRVDSRFAPSDASNLVLVADLYNDYYQITEYSSFDANHNPGVTAYYMIHDSLDWVSFSNQLDEVYGNDAIVLTADEMVEFPFVYSDADMFAYRENSYDEQGNLVATHEMRLDPDNYFFTFRYDEQGRTIEYTYGWDNYVNSQITTYDENTCLTKFFINQEYEGYKYRINSEDGGYSVQGYNSDDSRRYYRRYDGYGACIKDIQYGSGGCIEYEKAYDFSPDRITATSSGWYNGTAICERSEDGLFWTITEYSDDGSVNYVQLYTVLDLAAALNAQQ